MLKRLIPLVIAVSFAMIGLLDRDVRAVVDPDAARHMMNGALLYDMARSGGYRHPVEFATAYYGSYPAISIPYHPPLFPAVEAVLFSLFGPQTAVARLAVCGFVVATVLLLFSILRRLTGSEWMAALAVIAFMSTENCRNLASDIRLEMPCLAFTFAALYCLRDFDRPLSMPRSVGFALFAAAAFWTKQTAAFLVLVPWCLAVFAGRWDELRRWPLWVGGALAGLLCAPLVVIPPMLLRWSGANAGWRSTSMTERIWHHLGIYPYFVQLELTLVGSLLAAAGVAWAVAGVWRRGEHRMIQAFFLAWIIPSFAVPVVVQGYDRRYIMHVFPALIALALLMVTKIAQRWLPARMVWLPAALAVTVFVVPSWGMRMVQLEGLREAARFSAAQHPKRLLYGGGLVGPFAAYLREFNQPGETLILRVDQLPPDQLAPADLDRAGYQYGIDQVVVMTPDHIAKEYLWLPGLPTAKMKLLKAFPLTSTDWNWRGQIAVYEFTSRSANPEPLPKRKSRTLGRELDPSASEQ